MGKESRSFRMEIDTKEIIWKESQMAMGNIIGLMVLTTKEILNKELEMEEEFTTNQMVTDILANTLMIANKEKEPSIILTKALLMGHLLLIKKTDKDVLSLTREL